MAIVAGVDFGTQSVRVSIVDSARGSLGWGVSEYPVKRDQRDPDFATQSHDAHMSALVAAMKTALEASKVPGASVEAIALDTTGSTVIPVGKGLVPLTTIISGATTGRTRRLPSLRASRTRRAWVR